MVPIPPQGVATCGLALGTCTSYSSFLIRHVYVRLAEATGRRRSVNRPTPAAFRDTHFDSSSLSPIAPSEFVESGTFQAIGVVLLMTRLAHTVVSGLPHHILLLSLSTMS